MCIFFLKIRQQEKFNSCSTKQIVIEKYCLSTNSSEENKKTN